MHFDVDSYLPFVMCTVVGSFEGSVQIPSEKYSHIDVSSFMRDSNLFHLCGSGFVRGFVSLLISYKNFSHPPSILYRVHEK